MKLVTGALKLTNYRSSHQEAFLAKGVLKLWSKFTGEHPCQSMISIKLLCNFIEIALQLGCFLVNLLHIFRTTLEKHVQTTLFSEKHVQTAASEITYTLEFSHLLKKQNFIKINILIQKSLLENPYGKLNQCLSSYNDMHKSLVMKAFMSTKGGFESTDFYADWPCTTLYLILNTNRRTSS